MLATLDNYDRVPRILRLNLSGQPVDWATWQEAVCLYARNLVVWKRGESILRLRGGRSRFDGSRTTMDVHSIIACGGRIARHGRTIPPAHQPGAVRAGPQPLPLLRWRIRGCRPDAGSRGAEVARG